MPKRKWKKITAIFGLATATLWLGGCAGGTRARPCSASAQSRGDFCYRGINFGQANDPLYRQGIRDGCSTGQGYFRKNYRLSGDSEAYRRGWDRGRALCRPAGWSDAPTYSYHPLPSSATSRSSGDSSRYLSTQERIRRYSHDADSAYPSSGRASRESASLSSEPEVIPYR